MSAGLFDHHEQFLHDRAIDPAVARERGYSSTVARGVLGGMGFSHAAARLGTGLLIPVWDASGAKRYEQFRPDRPRLDARGRPVKYETPAGARLVLDVPPRIVNKLPDSSEPLWITEGPVKADAAVSAGLTCIGMTGVWGGGAPIAGVARPPCPTGSRST